jgi:hypothetical protein
MIVIIINFIFCENIIYFYQAQASDQFLATNKEICLKTKKNL